MQIGQRTVTEPVGASTEIGTHRLHPLQRTTWTRFLSGVGMSAQRLPFQTCGSEPMKTLEGRYTCLAPQTVHGTLAGRTGTPRVRLGVWAPQALHLTSA